ncbi:MAG: DUF6077 domain-containing protein [Actinomycetota bacterium]|nr:DUF6077 domain-containing protein [Actinomycetota bacterium]
MTRETRPGPDTLVGRLIDAVLDVAVISFAAWTLLYCLALPTQWSLWPSGWIWLVLTLVVLVWRVRLALPADDRPDLLPDALLGAEEVDAGPERRDLLLVAGLGLVTVAAVGGLIWTSGTFRFTWAALMLGIALLVGWSWLSGRVRALPEADTAAGPPEPAARWSRLVSPRELGVLAVMVGTGVLTAFVHLADTDDPYYLNRSVWVAERGNAALLDTMFSAEQFNSPYGGGVPIASIESLYGVIAHMTGTLAGTINYLVAAPAAACLAVLAIWRLSRRWAPRRAFLVFAGAIAFLMLSGDSMLGNFWIVRIWQGKVIAVAMLMPLIWAYLVDAHEARTRQGRWAAVGLLFAAGIAFFGLTPTAVVWAPVILAAVLVSAVALRSSALAWGGLAVSIGPFVSGAAVVAWSVEEVGGEDPAALSARASFVRILGEQTPMVALSLIALGVAVVLARRGAPAALAGSAALGSVLVFAPGILPLVNTVTGAGPILWRMLYVAPIPVLVGLLLAAPVPNLGSARQGLARAVPVLAVVVVLAGLVLGGRPIWSHTGHGGPVTLRSSPDWKLDTEALADVRILADRGVTGEVLLPPRRMKVLTMYTVQAFPVVPREWFIENIEEPRAHSNARRVLYQLASGERPLPNKQNAAEALELLGVDLACTGVSDNTERVMKSYAAAGYTDEATYGTLSCAYRPDLMPGSSSAGPVD